MTNVTRIFEQIERTKRLAVEKLFPQVYDELRRIAGARMAQENRGHPLQPTALVHEAWLRLVKVEQAGRWESRGHFFAAAAAAMRRILVESARRKESGIGQGSTGIGRAGLSPSLPRWPTPSDGFSQKHL